MTLVVKLTTQCGKTRKGEYNETQWGEGVQHTAPGGPLGTEKVIHAYPSPEVAVLMNPIHADIPDPVLWECDADVSIRDNGDLKVGCTRLRTVRRIPLPVATTEQRVLFAIACARAVFPREACPEWHDWADQYEAGVSWARTAAAAAAAVAAAEATGPGKEARAAEAAARAAVWAEGAKTNDAAARAAWAARAARAATRAAAGAAEWAEATWAAARAATRAAEAVAETAWVAMQGAETEVEASTLSSLMTSAEVAAMAAETSLWPTRRLAAAGVAMSVADMPCRPHIDFVALARKALAG